MRVHLVGAEDGADDVDLVAEALGERRPERPVDEPAGEDRLIGRPALPAEERARDLARGVHALLDVDGEGEEVGPLPDLAGCGRRDEDHGVPEAGDDGAVGLAGKFSCLEGQGAVGPAYGAPTR